MADYDPKKFKETKEHAAQMEQDNSKRNLMYDEMDKLYWMTWDEESIVTEQMSNIKVTRSPLARNSIMGAMRLLTATDPTFSVPHDINNAEAVEQSSDIEKFIKAMWFASGRISGDPLHNEVIRSALLYSEVVIGINSTKDMAKMATIPAIKRRMEDVSNKTPYLFEVWAPRSCHTKRDKFGITAFFRKTNTTAGHIVDVYGSEGEAALRSNKKKTNYKRTDPVTFNMYYDLQDLCFWCDSTEKPVKHEEHNLPFIPVVSQTVEGSALFDGLSYYQQEPFLFTLSRTKLLERQNLILTTLYTMMFAIGANPMFADFTLQPENAPEPDFAQPGGTIHYRTGERREVMAKQVLDPSLMQGWEISQDLESQSTIYKQTLGEPLSGNAPYSMVALLSQSGRLPLEAAQKKSGWAIAEACEIAVKWMKYDGFSSKAKYQAITAELSPEQIPEDVDIEVKLEIKMPTDRLQAANAANMLAQGEDPMVSHRWAQENVLDIGQPEDMQKEIWNEKAQNIFFQKYMYQQLMELAQIKQAAMMPGNAGGIPGAPAGQMPMQPPGAMPQGGQMAPEQGMTPPGGMGVPQGGTPMQPPSPERQVQPMEPLPPAPPVLARQRPR